MSKQAQINVTRFVSRPKNTPFAPSWDYFMFEKNIKKINYKNFSKFLLSKEKEILKLAPTKTSNKVTVGYTGLKENTTTARYGSYNVLSWKDKNVKILKDEIVNFHNQICEPEIYYSKNEVGKITLFQNNIPHGTSIQEKNKKRITIAFDLFTKNMNPNCVRLI